MKVSTITSLVGTKLNHRGELVTLHNVRVYIGDRMRAYSLPMTLEELDDEVQRFRFDCLEADIKEAFWKARASALREIKEMFQGLRYQLEMRALRSDEWSVLDQEYPCQSN